MIRSTIAWAVQEAYAQCPQPHTLPAFLFGTLPLQMRQAARLRVLLEAMDRWIRQGPDRPGWNFFAHMEMAILRDLLGKEFLSLRDRAGLARVRTSIELMSQVPLPRSITMGEVMNIGKGPMERARSLTVSLGLYNVAKEEQNRIIPPLSSIPPVSGEWIRWGGPVVHSNLATEGAILFLHGGGFFMGSAKSHRAINFRLSRASGKSIFSANYRLAPEHPFPAALEDAIAAFMYMTMEMDIPAHRIILCGDSAGGCLAVQVSMALRDMDQAIPGGVVMWSPWLDVMHSSPSIDSASADYLPDPRRQLGPCPGLWDGVHYYAPEPDMLRHPWVSPHYKEDLSGLPPMLIQCGQAERLRDEAVSFAARASLDRQDQGHVPPFTLDVLDKIKEEEEEEEEERRGRDSGIESMVTTEDEGIPEEVFETEEEGPEGPGTPLGMEMDEGEGTSIASSSTSPSPALSSSPPSLEKRVRLEVYEDMPHVWHNFATVPLAQEALDRTANFTQVVLDDSVKEGKDDGTRIGWGKWKVGHGGIVSPYHHDE